MQPPRPEATEACSSGGKTPVHHGRPPLDRKLISAAAQHPKEHQKEVDEVKIKSQGTDDGVGTHPFLRHHRRHLFQALRVPRRQPREHDQRR
jgi:hypothetical protein